MYRSLSCLALFFALGCSLLPAQMHVAEPPVNLGDTSFLDGVAGPGVLVEQIADGNHDGRIVGTKGVPVAGQVNSISGITHVAWLTHRKFLGAWYGVEAIGTEAYVNAGTHGEQGGLGDVTVSPLVLQWSQRQTLHILVDQRVVVDFGLPSGYYNRSQAVNLGSNTFTANPYYSITAHLSRRVETSWRIHYLWNSTNNAPPQGGGYASTQAGQAIHFNATAAYNVRGGLWLGTNSYLLAQVTSGRINGTAVPDSPEHVAALGAGLVYGRNRWSFFVNQYEEFAAENRPMGQKYVVRLTKIF